MKSLLIRSIIFILLTFGFSFPAQAFWVWTPETNKWVNPKYAVKDTPGEQLIFALEFYKSKQYDEAVRELDKLLKHYPRSMEAPDAQFYIGVCAEEQGKLFDAFKNYQLGIDKYPFSERSSAIVEKQYNIALKLLEGGDNRGFFIETVTGASHDVIEVFRAVIKNAPYGKYAAPSQYKIGLYLLEKNLFQEARDELEKVINDYPDSEWAKAARYQIALSDAKRSSDPQYDQKVTRSAIDEFKDFVKDNPDVELSDKAKNEIHKLNEKEAENQFVIAAFYEKQKKYDSAKTYYTSIVEDYQTTSWAKKALNRLQEIEGKKIKQ